VPLGVDGLALTVGAGARATIGVFNRTGMVLVGGTFLGPPLKVPAGTGFVSFTLQPTLALGGGQYRMKGFAHVLAHRRAESSAQ
jgi:hypothetical protein